MEESLHISSNMTANTQTTLGMNMPEAGTNLLEKFNWAIYINESDNESECEGTD